MSTTLYTLMDNTDEKVLEEVMFFAGDPGLAHDLYLTISKTYEMRQE